MRETGGEEPMMIAAADDSEELPCRGEQGDGGQLAGEAGSRQVCARGAENWEFVHRWGGTPVVERGRS